jgi:hypothetical protein
LKVVVNTKLKIEKKSKKKKYIRCPHLSTPFTGFLTYIYNNLISIYILLKIGEGGGEEEVAD